MEKQVGKINFAGHMKIVYAHIQRYDRSSPGGETYYEQDIFFFEKKCGHYKIIDDIIICRYKKQITELDSHGFGQTDGVWPEDDHPKAVYSYPKKKMK